MKTEELMGLEVQGIVISEDYIKWAEEMLGDNPHSDNLAILAGLDLERPINSLEVKKYFKASLEDLGIEWPDPQTMFREYARFIAIKIVEGSIDPEKGALKLGCRIPYDDLSY